MNAIDFLLNEHQKVRHTFEDIANPSHKPETKKRLFNELRHELIRHETMEHKIWYPHFTDNKKIDDTVKHLISEEKHAEKALKQFDNVETFAIWEEKFNKLRKEVEHHAKEEETKLFPAIKKLFTKEELEKIGHEMHAFKKSFSKEKNC